MTRVAALEIARKNRLAMNTELFAVWGKVFANRGFLRAAIREIEAKYGYRHGWFKVENFNFNQYDLDDVAVPTYDA